MNETQIMEEEEISLFDLWEKLRNRWKVVLGMTALGLAGAIVAILVIHPKYEAVAMLKGSKVAGSIVEDPGMIAERVRSPAFLLEVAQEVGDVGWQEDLHNGEGKKVLSAQVPKTTPNVIEIQIRAGSPEAVMKIADSATHLVIKRQDELSKGVLGKIRFDLEVAKEKLARAEKELSELSKTLQSTQVKDERFSQISLMTSLRLQKESEMFGLRQSVYALEVSLLPPATQPAKVLEAIFVPRKPVSPKKSLLVVLGLMGGLLVGVMSVFVADAWRQAKERHRVIPAPENR